MDELTTVSSTADLGAVRRSVAAAAAHALGDETAADVALVVSELVTNALEHGTGSRVAVSYGSIPAGFQLCVASAAEGEPIAAERPVPVERTHGRGLQIVSTIADHVSVSTLHGNVAVQCRFDKR